MVFTPRHPADEWQFQSREGTVSINVTGDVRSNVGDALRTAAIQGCGLAQLPTYQETG